MKIDFDESLAQELTEEQLSEMYFNHESCLIEFNKAEYSLRAMRNELSIELLKEV